VAVAFCTDCEETNYTIGINQFILPIDGFKPSRLETGLLAIAVLAEDIEFSSTIAKICLNADPIKQYIGEMVKVTGWGFMDSSIIPEGPINEVDAPIVENKKCKKVNSRKTRWQKEFCAGRRDGSGPCIGKFTVLWAFRKSS
jgi:hypothetical protein